MTRGAPTGLFAEVLPPVAKKAVLPRMHLRGVDGDEPAPKKAKRKRVAGTAGISGPWGEDEIRYDGPEFDSDLAEAKALMLENGTRGGIIKRRKNKDIPASTREHFRLMIGLPE